MSQLGHASIAKIPIAGTLLYMVVALESLPSLNAEQLRTLAAELIDRVTQQSQAIAERDSDILYRQAKIDKLTHELATLKRWKFGRSSELLNAGQISLLDETIEAYIAAIEQELKALTPAAKTDTQPRQQPKRAALPAGLPRVDIHHEPDSTTCGCGCQLKRIGQDVAERLDYTPGVFTVEQHIRGKWACAQCGTLIQAPIQAQIIDKGIPSAGLLAQVLVAKYSDHLPLCRKEQIFGRAGVALPCSTLAQWVGICGVQLQPLVDALKGTILSHPVLHDDETPVQMLKPGTKKTHRAYLWAYAPGAFEDLKAVVYDFCESRAGEHARTFLGEWKGSLICDDYAGYKAGFMSGITEVGCMAHSRRKFFDLHASSKSQIAGQACAYISELYDVEREIKHLLPDERLRERQKQSKPLADAFHQWMLLQRQKITDGSATAKALDYSLKRWGALTQFLDDGQLPIDNNWIENQIRPIAIGRSNWLFAGTLRAGQRAAAVMSLIQSALCRVRHRALYADHRTMPNGFASFWILHSWRVTGSA